MRRSTSWSRALDVVPSLALVGYCPTLVRRLAGVSQRHAGRFARFLLVGLSGVFVNMGILWFLTEIGGIYYLLSSLVAVETSILTNFLLNNAWTFRDRSQGCVQLGALGRYNLICLGGIVASTAILYALTTWVGLYYLAANMLAIAITSIWNFVANASWTWRLGRRTDAKGVAKI